MEIASKQEIPNDSPMSLQRLNGLIAGIGLAICAYLIWPAFNAVHLEGFTAQTESMAMLKARAPSVEHDPYLPIVSQFIYQTRTAVVDALSLIYKIAPGAGDHAFQGLVIASFVLLLVSSILFARRWSNVSPLYAFFALILTQGIPETAFFFNDNIVSAALAITAATVISKRTNKLEWLLSGTFFGLAVLSRIDAVFMFPVIVGVVFHGCQDNKVRLFATATIGFVALAVLVISAVVHGFSLLDAVSTAQKFVLNIEGGHRWLWIRILFFGLAALPLLLLGVWLNYRQLKRDHANFGILTFIAYPALLALVAPKATEIRYIFPLLSPFVALHAGAGLRWVYTKCVAGAGKARFLSWAIACFGVIVFLWPPTFFQLRDGPRVLLGRIWTPTLWARWQGSVRTTMDHSRQLTDLLDKQRMNVLISTHYNDEFYMRLRLIEAGFTPLSASSIFPGCNGFSVFRKGNSLVAHIRTEPQYRIAPVSITYNAALQIFSAFSCNAIQAFDKFYITTYGFNTYGIDPKVYGFTASSFQEPMSVSLADIQNTSSTTLLKSQPDHQIKSGIFNFRELNSDEITKMKLNAEAYLLSSPEKDLRTGKAVTIDNYSQYYSTE